MPRKPEKYGKISKELRDLIETADLSLDIRKTIAKKNGVHYNQLRAIVTGDAKLNKKNFAILQELVLFSVGSIKTTQEDLEKKLKYYNSAKYQNFIEDAKHRLRDSRR